MTKDLALAMKGKDMGRGDWVTTDEYMKKVHVSLATLLPLCDCGATFIVRLWLTN